MLKASPCFVHLKDCDEAIQGLQQRVYIADECSQPQNHKEALLNQKGWVKLPVLQWPVGQEVQAGLQRTKPSDGA